MSFTQRFTEWARPLTRLNPASQTVVQETARVDMALYNRAVAVLMLGAMGGSAVLNAKLIQHNAASGGTSKDITGKAITPLTQAGTDINKIAAIELRTEELDVNGGFHWVSLSMTPSVSTAIIGAILFGLEPRYPPAGVTEWDEVVD